VCYGETEIQNEEQFGDIKLIKLKEDNFVTLRGNINEESSSEFISNIMQLKSEEIYIYIYSPGGSIINGNDIIQILNSLKLNNKKIVCIADHAYSMGFAIFQSCPVRYVLPHSVIMQHQANLEVKGPIEQSRTMFGFIERIIDKADEIQSKKLNLSVEEFNDIIKHDLWLYGDEIIERNAADEIVNVICDFDTDKTEKIRRNSLFGYTELEFSKCPLIHFPKNINYTVKENEIIESVKREFISFN
jgi:ATP-dependent Clp protease protease subunit